MIVLQISIARQEVERLKKLNRSNSREDVKAELKDVIEVKKKCTIHYDRDLKVAIDNPNLVEAIERIQTKAVAARDSVLK